MNRFLLLARETSILHASAAFKFLNDFHLLQLDVGMHEVLPPNNVCIFLYASYCG